MIIAAYLSKISFQFLINAIIPSQLILRENKSHKTHEQAVEVVKLAKGYKWKHLAMIASAYYQHRAYLTFLEEVMNSRLDLLLFNSPIHNLYWYSNNKWEKRIDCINAEFDMIERYWTMGHLASIEDAINHQEQKEFEINKRNTIVLF